MKIGSVQARTIIQKSGLSDHSYSVNTFTGCAHACVYCYACFMRRFSERTEPWGEYVDAKVNAAELFSREVDKLKSGEHLFFGSVTDVYLPAERQFRLMRAILERLVEKENDSDRRSNGARYFPGMEPEPIERPEIRFSILTKSDLVLRDVDLLSRLPNATVGFSIALFDERARKILEPGAVSIQRRLDALGRLRAAGIRTFVFINPALPYLTPIAEIMAAIRGRADSVFGETLNRRCGNLADIFRAVERYDPALTEPFRRAVGDVRFAAEQKAEFLRAAKENEIETDGFWDHAE